MSLTARERKQVGRWRGERSEIGQVRGRVGCVCVRVCEGVHRDWGGGGRDVRQLSYCCSVLRDETEAHIRQRGKQAGGRLERRKVKDRPKGGDQENKIQR